MEKMIKLRTKANVFKGGKAIEECHRELRANK